MENVAWRQRLESCGHKPRHVKSHQKLLGEVRNGLPVEPLEEARPLTTHFRLLASRTVSKWIHFLGVNPLSLCSFAAATPKKLMRETYSLPALFPLLFPGTDRGGRVSLRWNSPL